MKGRLWCDGLPHVTVSHGTTPKRVTLVYPYYEAPKFFERQQENWLAYSQELFGHWSAVVVDDGSPVSPARLAYCNPHVRVFRIERDVPWNWLAARNIGAHHAADGWLLLTDMDHVVPEETLRGLIYGQHDPGVVYAFSRMDATAGAIHPHSASFFMTRAMFWTIGGYDERLSGVYGTDGLYRKRLAATAPIQILSDVLVRYEYVADSSVTTYERKTEAMGAAKRAKLAAIRPGSTPRTLSFPYHEVTA